jgi:hypothetical protein
MVRVCFDKWERLFMSSVTPRSEGDESWFRLRDRKIDQKAAERLAGHVLRAEGYKSLDPSHPLGGKDSLKDFACLSPSGNRCVVAVYFPRGQESFTKIRAKFKSDLAGVSANAATAFVFVTNQELSLAQRTSLKEDAGAVQLDLFHLERLSSIIDSPELSSVRSEYLGIPISQEDLVGFLAKESARQHLRDMALDASLEKIEQLLENLPKTKGIADSVAAATSEITEIRKQLSQDGHILPPGQTDNAYDLGARWKRFRFGFFGEAVEVGMFAAYTGAVRLPARSSINARSTTGNSDIPLIQLSHEDRVLVGDSSTAGIRFGASELGFFGSNGGVRPTVTGSVASNQALRSLIAALAGLGLIHDKTAS